MRRLLSLLVLTAVLAAAPNALAKGTSTAARVCGASGCHAVDLSSLPALADGVPAPPPAHPVAYITLTTTVDYGPDAAPRELRIDYVPSLGITRPTGSHDDTQWVRASDEDRALLDHVVAPFAPYPAATSHAAASTPWWTIAGAAAAALGLLALLARYATSALKARPRASKSAN